jgi:hypothetical protein
VLPPDIYLQIYSSRFERSAPFLFNKVRLQTARIIEAERDRTPSGRMLTSVIGEPGGCFGAIVLLHAVRCS